jgi:hypothetical protein
MTRNEGTFDRALRIGIGGALLALFFLRPDMWFGLLGVVPLVTGIAGFCPVYCALGIRTRTAH